MEVLWRLQAPPEAGSGCRSRLRGIVGVCWLRMVAGLRGWRVSSSKLSSSVASCRPAGYCGFLSASSMPSRVSSKHPLVHARHAVHIECFRRLGSPAPEDVAIFMSSRKLSASIASYRPARCRGFLSAPSMPSRVPNKHPLVHARHAVHVECFRHPGPGPAPGEKHGPSCQSNHQPVDQKSRLDRFACFQQSMVFLSAP